MNALALLFAWLFAAMSGGDPCDNAAYAEANTAECATVTLGQTVSQPAMPSVTDISNGF